MSQENKIEIGSLTLEELQVQLERFGQPKYRAKQVFDWLHCKLIDDFSQMSNLSLSFRAVLSQNFYINSTKIKKTLVSLVDNTVKYLYVLPDGHLIESVLMEYRHGNSICISTQVGCKMGCSFCASADLGFTRNLTPYEMLSQIYAAQKQSGRKINHVVLMGIGEPLDNFENVLKFLRLISCAEGCNISMRSISLSTCGLVGRIKELQELKLGVTLSVSLHAPFDEMRSSMMPVNRKWNIAELVACCGEYAVVTGRRISYEYAFIKDVNDSDECAFELVKLLGGQLCHVNIIPVNPVEKKQYTASSRARMDRFKTILEQHKITATVRRTLGADINAACGQLRRSEINMEKEGHRK